MASALDRLRAERRRLAPLVNGAWTAEHRHEVNLLREVDSLIAKHRRQDQPSLEQQVHINRDSGRDTGIDLGL